MKESYGEGVASHTDPESCGAAREDSVEALTGERAGRVFSRERTSLRGADAVRRSGRLHPARRYRETRRDPARSETPCTYANTSHENREVPCLPVAVGAGDRNLKRPLAPTAPPRPSVPPANLLPCPPARAPRSRPGAAKVKRRGRAVTAQRGTPRGRNQDRTRLDELPRLQQQMRGSHPPGDEPAPTRGARAGSPSTAPAPTAGARGRESR